MGRVVIHAPCQLDQRQRASYMARALRRSYSPTRATRRGRGAGDAKLWEDSRMTDRNTRQRGSGGESSNREEGGLSASQGGSRSGSTGGSRGAEQRGDGRRSLESAGAG